MRSEILIKMRASLSWRDFSCVCVCVCVWLRGTQTEIRSGIKKWGRERERERGKKKRVQLALSQEAGPCIVILFRLGVATFNLTQWQMDLTLQKKKKVRERERERERQAARRTWLTTDVALQWQEVINNEREVDNKAAHFLASQRKLLLPPDWSFQMCNLF